MKKGGTCRLLTETALLPAQLISDSLTHVFAFGSGPPFHGDADAGPSLFISSPAFCPLIIKRTVIDSNKSSNQSTKFWMKNIYKL